MRIKEELSIIWIALVSSSIFYVVCECLVFVLLAMFFVCKRASWPSLPNFDRNPQIVQHLQHSRMNGDFQILTETHKLFNTCQYSRMNGINKEREPLVFCPFEEGFWFSVSDSHAQVEFKQVVLRGHNGEEENLGGAFQVLEQLGFS